MSHERIPLRRAIAYILLSILIVTGGTTFTVGYYRQKIAAKKQDPAYDIEALLQTTPGKESLKTIYLAELLGLSIDQPTNLYNFNTKEAKRRLLSLRAVSEVQVKKIPPSTIYVDYTLRQPIAFLGDVSNTALDHSGTLFPFTPFYTPKRLPKVYLGTNVPFAWGDKLRGPHAQLAFELLSLLNELAEGQDLVVKEIDVSHAFSPSYGQRHIAVVIDEYYSDTSGYTTQTRTLRLSPKHIAEGITNYAKMRTHLNENISKEAVIDLRIPRLAFLADTDSSSKLSMQTGI